MNPYRESAARDPEDTLTECEPLEEAEGQILDTLGEVYGVMRIPGEVDVDYRERIRESLRVSRAARKAARGESLVPAIQAMLLVTWVVEYLDRLVNGEAVLARREFPDFDSAKTFAAQTAPVVGVSPYGQLPRVIREERLP